MTAQPPHAGTKALTVVFAGGGSGGHISPGLAIAERLEEAPGGPGRAIFVCSDRPVDDRMLSAAGARYRPIPARPLARNPRHLPGFLLAFRRATRLCGDLLRRERVDLVVALGGFVSAPAVAAARKLGIPATLINLDDPPGRANRWTARRCHRVWSAVPLPGHPSFAERVVGLPIRRQALAPAPAPECRARLGLDPDRPTLLVTGASQGATSINELLVRVVSTDPGALAGWQVCHLAGAGAAPALRAAYESAGTPAVVEPFLDEMGLAWGAASLAISRAGANSVGEARANAVPTLFLPYPYHRDRHQENNARPMVDLGGAVVETDRRDVEANVTHIGPRLRELLADETGLCAMRRALERHRPPDAASDIAASLLATRTRVIPRR